MADALAIILLILTGIMKVGAGIMIILEDDE